MGWRRQVRYVRERVPGKGVMVDVVHRGRDAPLGRRDELILVCALAGLIILSLLIAALARLLL